MDIILKTDHLTKSFGDVVAVNSLSFEAYRGEVLGFLGPNGAGKTTSIKMMSGLLNPDSGSISLNCKKGARSIGVCPQNIVVWENLTCVEQLIYMGQMYEIPYKRSKQRATDLLATLGISAKSRKLAKTLSGGMKRRLNIALALIHEPELVFLDEPQAGLDPQSRVLVREYIQSIKSITSVILTTHDMEEAEKLSDRVCVIDQGKVLAFGTTEEIKQASGQHDIVDIEINGNIQKDLIPFLSDTALSFTQSAENSASFTVDSYGVFEEIFTVTQQKELRVNHLRLRKKSLEDVFIQLTGRSLRE